MTELTAFDDPAYRAAAVDLLGVLAYGELTAFERIAEDAKLAPTLDDKAQLAQLATTEFGHFVQLRDRLVALGVDPMDAMQPFVTPLDAFHDHTAPSDWLEGLVKAYVGDGLANDFYREVAAYVDARPAHSSSRSSPTPARPSSWWTASAPRSRKTRKSAAGSPSGAAASSARPLAKPSESPPTETRSPPSWPAA